MYVFTLMACSSSKRGMMLDEFLDFYEFYFWIRCVSSWLSSSGRWKGEAGGLYIPSELPTIAHFPLLLLLRSCSYLLRWCGLYTPSELPTIAHFSLLLLLRSCSYLLRWWAPSPQASVIRELSQRKAWDFNSVALVFLRIGCCGSSTV